MNPDPNGHGLTLNISESSNALDLALAQDVASWFRLKSMDAKKIIADVVNAVRTWRGEAEGLRLSRHSQERMRAAFLHGS